MRKSDKATDAATMEEARRLVIEACRAQGVPLAMIRRAIGGSRLVPPKKVKAWKRGTPPTIAQIVDVFLAALEQHADKVELADLQSPRVLRIWAGPRACAMYAIREILKDATTLQAIGAFFNRDHSTVVTALQTGAARAVEQDPRLKKVGAQTVAFFRTAK